MIRHRIGIIGAGYVGSACEMAFSSMTKTQVMVHDKYKPTETLHHVVTNSVVLFVCVPTPMQEDGSCDTSIVEECIRQIASCQKNSKTIVIKSTITPGTTDTLQAKFPDHHLFFNPEFLTEKNFISDFANQRNIILGQPTHRLFKFRKLIDSFYRDFAASQKVPGKIIWTKATTAEMLKYTTNSFLAAKVSFFNEIHQICRAMGVDYNQLLLLLDQDDRIGRTHKIVPGPDGEFGFGGSCFPKDLNALIALAREYGLDPMILEAAWVKNLMVRETYDWESLPQVNGQYAEATATATATAAIGH
jgi:UDPglucose 6-dehydrogenase